MEKMSEFLRKCTRLFLAIFLWLHAIFFLNFQSLFVSRCAQFLHLKASEVVMVCLLALFSLASGSGFWKPIRSAAYIYGFPFVLAWYAMYACFLVLRGTHRWLKAQITPEIGTPPVAAQNIAPIASLPVAALVANVNPKTKALGFLKFVLRPFRRFTFLWCILLLVTTHIAVLWLCLVVVLFHLGRDVLRIIKLLFFSNTWLKKIAAAVHSGIETTLSVIAAFTPDMSPTPELRNAWNQLNLWTKIVNFLKEPYLVSGWAWIIGIFSFGSLYIYIAVLFSFAYYGIAQVSGLDYRWPEALTSSVFIPFFVADLPKTLVLRFLGGLHCTLVIAVGVGTLITFIQRKLRAIHTAAMDLDRRLRDQAIIDKYLIIETKLATAPGSTAQSTKI